MPFIDCEINLILNCSANYFLVAGTVINQVPTFAITDENIYVPVVTLSTQDKVKLLEQLKYGFKRTINWNNYQSKMTMQARNQYLDYLAYPSFQAVNRLSVLSYENIR